MKILLLGCNGQVGWELQRSLAPLGELVALDRRGSGGLVGDLADTEGLRETVARIGPEVIVNAGAHTAVDRAESEPELARRINAAAPGALAAEARARGAWLVHYSTDYVFDGSACRPWREDDPTGPLSVYGRTKLEGEEAIRASGCRHLILRTSWVYAARGRNFVHTMLRLAAERERLTVVDDQVGAPTGAELIADVTAQLMAKLAGAEDGKRGGVYHLGAGGETSWHGYAHFVIGEARRRGANLKVAEIAPVPTSAYPTPAARPLNSRLDTSRLRSTFGLTLPDWRTGVERVLDEVMT
jgi:dTDP-4-dehydrorhamnose reductase